MTTIAGALTVDEYPDEIAGGARDEVWVQRGAGLDEVELCDDQLVARLCLSRIDGQLLWRRHIEERVIAVASERGEPVYLVDLASWRILTTIDLWRVEQSYWRRTALLATPDESRCVVVSDLLVHVLTWRGVLVYARRIEPTDRFMSLGNDSYTLSDEPNGSLKFTMPFPKAAPFQSE